MGYYEEDNNEPEKMEKNTGFNVKGFLCATGVLLMGTSAVYVGLPLADITPEPEPETSDSVITLTEKQKLFDVGAVSLLLDTHKAESYGLMSAAQADEIKTAAQTIGFETRPDELLQALKAVDDGGKPYLSSISSSNPNAPYNVTKFSPAFYEIQSIFKDYLSPQLDTFYSMVDGDNGCIGRFGQPDENENYVSSVQAHMPDGVGNMQCENGADVNVLVYTGGEEGDVRVSYDFEHAVAYFEKTGSYALENCKDENDCFSSIPFTELKDSKGLTQAFADKTAAEASLTEIKTQARDYFAENWPQIQTDMDSVTKQAVPAPR